jgi:hypothetical protein
MKGQKVCLSFSFISVLVLLLLLLLINLSFILIIIYLYFFFSYFLFVLIELYLGIIPSSNINDCLWSIICYSWCTHLHFDDKKSCFICNRKISGSFLKSWRLNYVIQFFFIFIWFLFLFCFCLCAHILKDI